MLKKRCNGKFTAKMNLANAIRHVGCLFKFLCVRMVGVPTPTVLTRLMNFSPDRINERTIAVRPVRTVLRRVRTVDVGTPTILTHKNLNKRPAWRIALAKFILAANLPLQRFYDTFTCPNVTLTLHCATCIAIKLLRARSINVLDQSD